MISVLYIVMCFEPSRALVNLVKFAVIQDLMKLGVELL